MDVQTARRYTGADLKTALAGTPKPVLVELTEETDRRRVAVYSRGGRQGVPLGILTWRQVAIALAATGKKMTLLAGPALTDEGELVPDLRPGLSDDRRAELTARRDDLAARLAEVEAKLV